MKPGLPLCCLFSEKHAGLDIYLNFSYIDLIIMKLWYSNERLAMVS